MSKIKKKKLIPLSYDLVFKKMFGDIEHKERVAYLLSALLNIPYEKIVNNIELDLTEKIVKNKKDKKQVQDVKVRIILSVNKRISLEMNMNYNETYINRNLSYLSGMFGNQLKKKEDYSLLEPCIQFNFNTIYTDIDNKVLIDEYSMKNKYGYELTEKFKVVNLNIAECYNIVYNKDIKSYDEKYHDIIKFGAIMMATDYETLRKMLEEFQMEEDIKDEILDTMEEYSEDEEIGMWYDEEQNRRALYVGSLKEETQKARKKALEEGRVEGIKEGIKETAKNMLKDNVDIEIISKYTGLKKNEICSLK